MLPHFLSFDLSLHNYRLDTSPLSLKPCRLLFLDRIGDFDLLLFFSTFLSECRKDRGDDLELLIAFFFDLDLELERDCIFDFDLEVNFE